MESSGLRPHILSLDLTDAGREEAHARGWVAEQFDEPRYDLRTRLRQHAARRMLAPSPRLSARIAELGPSSALIQLEEIDALAYLSVACRTSTTVVSLHNVDSEARRGSMTAAAWGQRARSAYHLHRMRLAEARAAHQACAVVCVSPADQEHFDRVGARFTVLAPNGVDECLFSLPVDAAESGSVLFFGSTSWSPNLEGLNRFLQEGWPLVRRIRPDARLRIAGPGVDRALAARRDFDEGVDVVGLVDDIATELQRAAAVVVPIWSGGGTRLKVLEAMAAAKALVGTTLGVSGIGFVDREHGLVADDPTGLAEKLVQVLGDPGEARRYGLAAREHARAFEWTLATRELRAFYTRVTAPADAGWSP